VKEISAQVGEAEVSRLTDEPGEHCQSMRDCCSESICCQIAATSTPGSLLSMHGRVPLSVLAAPLAVCEEVTVKEYVLGSARVPAPAVPTTLRMTVPGVTSPPETTVPRGNPVVGKAAGGQAVV